MKAKIRWIGGVAFQADSGDHQITIDGAPEFGGRNLGPRPMETVLIGAAACAAFDVVHILRKAKQPLAECEAEIEAERADSEPRVFTRIFLRFFIGGANRPQAERAAALSVEKYCSALAMLSKTADISHSVEIRD